MYGNAAAGERPRKRALRSGVVTRRVGGDAAGVPKGRADAGPRPSDAPSRGRRPRAIPA